MRRAAAPPALEGREPAPERGVARGVVVVEGRHSRRAANSASARLSTRRRRRPRGRGRREPRAIAERRREDEEPLRQRAGHEEL